MSTKAEALLAFFDKRSEKMEQNVAKEPFNISGRQVTKYGGERAGYFRSEKPRIRDERISVKNSQVSGFLRITGGSMV